MKNLTLLEKFRRINMIEGISFLVLLFIAMPLKYYFGYPIATKIFGMIHGLFFMWFVVLLFQAHREYMFKSTFSFVLFLGSIIPFGSKFTDKYLTPETIKTRA
jgi:integral membrane protein